MSQLDFLAAIGRYEPVTLLLTAVILALTAVRAWTTRGRTRAPLILASLALFIGAGAVQGVPIAFTNAALTGSLAWGFFGIPTMRLGVNAPGDAPITWWYGQSGTCSSQTPAMVSDIGSCNNDAGSNSFVTMYGAGGADVREWGAKCDGVTNNATPIQAAVNVNPVGIILLPSGSCLINSEIRISLGGITVAGAGNGTPNQGITEAPTTLECRTVTTDCILIEPSGGQNVAPTNRIGNINLTGFLLDATGNTGGNAIDVRGAQFVIISEVTINNPYNGFAVWNDYFGNVHFKKAA